MAFSGTMVSSGQGRGGVFEIFSLFSIRTIYATLLSWRMVKGTRILRICIGIVTVAQLLVTYLPALRVVFHTRPVPLLDGLLMPGVCAAIFGVVDVGLRLRAARESRGFRARS